MNAELMNQDVVNHLIQEISKKLSEIESRESEIELNDNTEPIKVVPYSAGNLNVLIENLSRQFIGRWENREVWD